MARFTNYPLQQAIVLTDHSTDVQSGDEVGILLSLGTELLATAISERLGKRNTAPIVVTAPERVRRVYALAANPEERQRPSVPPTVFDYSETAFNSLQTSRDVVTNSNANRSEL